MQPLSTNVALALLTSLPGDAAPSAEDQAFTIRIVDLNDQTEGQVVVDREPGQYLGHPTTLLLEDGKSILCVYPKGHGKGAIVYKRSPDGGRTRARRPAAPTSGGAPP